MHYMHFYDKNHLKSMIIQIILFLFISMVEHLLLFFIILLLKKLYVYFLYPLYCHKYQIIHEALLHMSKELAKVLLHLIFFLLLLELLFHLLDNHLVFSLIRLTSLLIPFLLFIHMHRNLIYIALEAIFSLTLSWK